MTSSAIAWPSDEIIFFPSPPAKPNAHTILHDLMQLTSLPVPTRMPEPPTHFPPGYSTTFAPCFAVYPHDLAKVGNQQVALPVMPESMHMYYQDFVGFRRSLDRYAGQRVTWELLTFEHGFKTSWRGPQDAIRLYQHSATQVRLVTRERLVVFERTETSDGTLEFRCVSDNDSEWRLGRSGSRVVVQSAVRTFSFETPDTGSTWRLVETTPRGSPLAVRLKYEGPSTIPSALVYPDGTEAVLAASPYCDAVGSISLPNGIVFRIEYDGNGFPRMLEELVPAKAPVQSHVTGFTIVSDGSYLRQTVRYETIAHARHEIVLKWVWENDPLGRIRRQSGPCGQETRVEFAQQDSAGGKETVAVVTDDASGSFVYMRHKELADTWTIDRGSGNGNTSLDSAIVEARTVFQRRGNETRLVSRYSGATGLTMAVSYDDHGRETARSIPATAAAPAWHSPTAYLRAQSDAICRWNDQERPHQYISARYIVTFAYDDAGYLVGCTQNGIRYGFAFDALGRMTRKEYPDGSWEKFTYTSESQLDSYALFAPEPSSATSPTGSAVTPQVTMRFHYDLLGRLVRVESSARETLTAQYKCGQLKSVSDRSRQLYP